MILRIQYTDNRYDMVKGSMLDRLIEDHQITRFRRSSGWVTIGVDPVRTGNKKPGYSGPERRTNEG